MSLNKCDLTLCLWSPGVLYSVLYLAFRSKISPYFSLPVCICCCLITKLCPTLCDPMGCSPPGSSVHELSQARILEWVVISFSKGSSLPGVKLSLLHCRCTLYCLSHQGSSTAVLALCHSVLSASSQRDSLSVKLILLDFYVTCLSHEIKKTYYFTVDLDF